MLQAKHFAPVVNAGQQNDRPPTTPQQVPAWPCDAFEQSPPGAQHCWHCAEGRARWKVNGSCARTGKGLDDVRAVRCRTGVSSAADRLTPRANASRIGTWNCGCPVGHTGNVLTVARDFRALARDLRIKMRESILMGGHTEPLETCISRYRAPLHCGDAS